MLKKLFGSGLVALCCSMAQAAPQQWSFTYTGFQDVGANTFLPGEVLSGVFRGEDRDGDGVIGSGELSALMVAGVDFIACQTQEFYQCGISSFAYKPGGTLNFGLGYMAHDPEFYVRAGGYITAGVSHRTYRDEPGKHTERTLGWTPETSFLISAVPEPATYGMLAFGLGLVVVAARRQHRFLQKH